MVNLLPSGIVRKVCGTCLLLEGVSTLSPPTVAFLCLSLSICLRFSPSAMSVSLHTVESDTVENSIYTQMAECYSIALTLAFAMCQNGSQFE